MRQEAIDLTAAQEFAEDVRAGLVQTPKSLPSRWFYDAVGSALFEVITLLPEYYLTRTERLILRRSAGEIIAAVHPEAALVELGSGSAEKTRTLIRELATRQDRVTYCPIDISEAALDIAGRALTGEFPNLDYKPIIGRYQAGLDRVAQNARPKLVLFLGSSIGNFTKAGTTAFLQLIGNMMCPHDRLLLGTDMEKEEAVIRAAYDDPTGVTRAFNLNLLARINRELKADFDLEAFSHRMQYNREMHRAESYLVSKRDQKVHLGALDVDVAFAKDEAIHTENSTKYTPEMIDEAARAAGLVVDQAWYDDDRWFGLHLMRRT